MAGRGVAMSGIVKKAHERRLRRAYSQRRTYRVMALLTVLVVGATIGAQFTDNRLLAGVQAAGIAAAAPAALYLAFRRSPDSR